MLQFVQNIHDKLKGWRTVIFASLSTVPYLWLEIYDGLKEMGVDATPVLETLGWQKWIPLFGIAVGVITIIIRLDTKGPIGDKTAYQPATTPPVANT